VGYRNSKFNMTKTLTTNLGLGNFNAATVTDNSLIFNVFIFSTMTFPVLSRSENTIAEKTISLRLECSIVNGFRFFYFTK
jgi:hypothetical protein